MEHWVTIWPPARWNSTGVVGGKRAGPRLMHFKFCLFREWVFFIMWSIKILGGKKYMTHAAHEKLLGMEAFYIWNWWIDSRASKRNKTCHMNLYSYVHFRFCCCSDVRVIIYLFIIHVDNSLDVFSLLRRVHACCRCRRCDFTAPDSSALLDHFNSVHCHDSSPSLSSFVTTSLPTSLTPSLTLSANGCSAPSTLAIKEESKGDLRLLYSLAPPEGRLAEGGREEGGGVVKSEGGEEKEREREKGWVIGETRGIGERGGEQAHGLLWVPKERMGPDRGVERGTGGGSPSLFPSPLPLSFVSANHEASQQKRGVASPSMVYLGDTKSFLGDTKSFLGDAKLYGGGRPGGGGGAAGGGEKQSPMPSQQYTGGGGGGQEGKGGAAKEESQSLLRVRWTQSQPPTSLGSSFTSFSHWADSSFFVSLTPWLEFHPPPSSIPLNDPWALDHMQWAATMKSIFPSFILKVSSFSMCMIPLRIFLSHKLHSYIFLSHSQH